MSQSSPTDRTEGESRRRASGKASPRPPTAVGAAAPPISLGATKTASRSTSFASTNDGVKLPASFHQHGRHVHGEEPRGEVGHVHAAVVALAGQYRHAP